MVVGNPELVVARCKDLSQELINRDLHFVVGDVVLSYHQVQAFMFKVTNVESTLSGYGCSSLALPAGTSWASQ